MAASKLPYRQPQRLLTVAIQDWLSRRPLVRWPMNFRRAPRPDFALAQAPVEFGTARSRRWTAGASATLGALRPGLAWRRKFADAQRSG